MKYRHEGSFRKKCEELGCKNPAIYNFSGKKLCAEHYDIYRSGESALNLKEVD